LSDYSSSPGWELLSLSRKPATCGLAIYLTNFFSLSRWCLPIWVAAWREKPWMVALDGPSMDAKGLSYLTLANTKRCHTPYFIWFFHTHPFSHADPISSWKRVYLA
jgi:hypothetical protein